MEKTQTTETVHANQNRESELAKHKQQADVDRFKRIGFNVEDTGGGCQWLRKELDCGFSLVITNGEAALPDHEAQLFVHLDTEDISDTVAEGNLQPTDDLLSQLEKGYLHNLARR